MTFVTTDKIGVDKRASGTNVNKEKKMSKKPSSIALRNDSRTKGLGHSHEQLEMLNQYKMNRDK